jgi:hypothetical protein
MMTSMLDPKLMTLKLMTRRHLGRVMVLDKAYDPKEAWSEERWRDALLNGGMGYVLLNGPDQEETEILNFAFYKLDGDTLKVLKFAPVVSDGWSELDTRLLDKLQSKLDPGKLSKVNVEIRESDDSARTFFTRHGFKAVGLGRERYQGRGDNTGAEDSYVMLFDIHKFMMDGIETNTIDYGDPDDPNAPKEMPEAA